MMMIKNTNQLSKSKRKRKSSRKIQNKSQSKSQRKSQSKSTKRKSLFYWKPMRPNSSLSSTLNRNHKTRLCLIPLKYKTLLSLIPLK